MGCSNCFNGCTEIASDKCIKYTGINVPILGIQNGDSLSFVEQALIEFLVSTLDGVGIVLDIDSELICDLVSGYLPDCKDLSLADLSSALVQAACSLQTQVDTINTALDQKEGDYDIKCLSGVAGSDGTHIILQAVITLLCTINTSLTALSLDVNSNYVKVADIDDYIASYNESISASSLIRNKMIPNVAVEYYGSTSYFNATGAGTGNWEQVYLCNGLNKTPDKRGRVPVGAVTGMGGDTLDSEVNPITPGNPAYILNMKAGVNSIVLTSTQIPSHTHTASSNSTGAHTHQLGASYIRSDDDEPGNSAKGIWHSGSKIHTGTSSAYTLSDGAHSHTISVNPSGGGLSHANNQPALACYYIIYIPS